MVLILLTTILVGSPLQIVSLAAVILTVGSTQISTSIMLPEQRRELSALIVHGEDGIDEITISGKTFICELKDSYISSYTVSPEDFGLQGDSLDNLRGGDAKQNAELLLGILSGNKGPQQDVVLMNAAAVFMVGDMTKTFQQGVALAREMIDGRRALQKLEKLIKFSQKLAKENDVKSDNIKQSSGTRA